ncbi:DNA-processing protein DprA [Pedobacter sp. FW305-3-2-15-E-R2A2]|uniref:DNA-processing protein DprA n=1 Tax=Pedobacter sp. FW305-3-2-15-E-R2A2 TaxID=3140251 RepID=UPI003140B966
MKLTTEYLLTLLKTPKIGQVSVKFINDNIAYKLSNIGELHEAISELKTKNAKLSIPKLEDLKQAHYNTLRVLENADRLSIKAINYNEKNYPSKLLRLSDFPVIIYLKGSIDSILSKNAVAIIGTREPSDFGLRAGRKIAGIFAENNFTIISGLAKGSDTVGHLGAVDKNLPTVAVLAAGLDSIYPSENKHLSERIIETGGSLLSEYEPGMKLHPQQLVLRDRIQAGLSDGVIVIETGIKGGTMHAVSAAKKMGMPIACLTGHPSHMSDFDKIKGNAYLIDSGASSLGSSDQINSFMLKLNPDINLENIKNAESKIGAVVNEQNIKPSNGFDENNNEKPNVPPVDLKTGGYPEKNDIGTIEVIFENIEQKISEQEPSLGEIKELILKLTEEQRETNKLLKILVSQSPKDKSSKKKPDNQSSFL